MDNYAAKRILIVPKNNMHRRKRHARTVNINMGKKETKRVVRYYSFQDGASTGIFIQGILKPQY